MDAARRIFDEVFSYKTLLKIFHVVSFGIIIVSVIIIGCGLTASSVFSQHDPLLDSRYYAITNLVYSCTSISLLFVLIAYFSINKESYAFMYFVSGMCLLIFILSLTTGIIGLVLSGNSYHVIHNNLKTSIDSYLNGDAEVQKLWDGIQNQHSCCGIDGYEDWGKLIEDRFNETKLPMSCCTGLGKIGYSNCSYTKSTADYRYYQNRNWEYSRSGCGWQVSHLIEGFCGTLGIVTLILTVLQAVNVLVTGIAGKCIKNKLMGESETSSTRPLSEDFPVNHPGRRNFVSNY